MEIKDKPDTMGVREWLIKKVSLGINCPEKVVKAVMTHNYDSAYEAMDNFNSIEISNFGKFYFNTKKSIAELEKCVSQKEACQALLNEHTTTEKERLANERRINTLNKKIKYLIKKNGAI